MYTVYRDSVGHAKVETPTEAREAVATTKPTSAEAWTDSCPFLSLPAEIREMIYGYVLPKPSNTRPRWNGLCHSPLNILLTNCRISAEASSVLYSHFPVITMGYGLRKIHGPDFSEKGKGPKQYGTLRNKPWKFHPITNAKFLDVNGARAFSPHALGDALYLHVLTRFTRITLHVPLVYLEYGPLVPARLEIDSKFNVDVNSAKYLAGQMRSRHRMLNDFAKIISDSCHLTRLDIKIHVNVQAVFKYKLRFDNDADLARYREEKISAEKASNKRAVQIFLESEQLDRLRKVSTIQSITLKFFTETGQSLQDEMLPESLKAVEDLQRTVEKNWEERHQSISKHPATIRNL